jgi:hypothetical protein
MNTQILSEVIEKIISNDIPKDYKEFGGAGLIVTNDKTYTGHERDTVVFTNYNYEISWLIYQLQKVIKGKINYINKFYFYPLLGKTAIKLIEKNTQIDRILLNMIIEAILWSKDPKNEANNYPIVTFHFS